MSIVKFSAAGIILSSKNVDLKKRRDLETVDIVSNFRGEIFRIANQN